METAPEETAAPAPAATAEEVVEAVAAAMEAEPEEPLSMVAFDIVFMKDGEELQPANGLTVDVQFHVKAESDLITEETGSLQVYHVEGEGSDLTAQPVGEAAVVESAVQAQTLEVAAESFSIYAIVVKPSNPDSSYVVGEGGTVTLTGQNSSSWRPDHRWTVISGNGVVEITSSNENVAVVTAMSIGEATVQHSYRSSYGSNRSETFTVTVTAAGLTIQDNIKATGNLTAVLSDDLAGSQEVTYTWYRSQSGGDSSYTEVVRDKITGDDYNVDGANLNAALDYSASGTKRTDIRYYYYVTATVGGKTYTSEPYQVPYYMALQNGSFEDGDDIWKTTASDNAIEIGGYSQRMYVYGTQNDKPSSDSGSQFAELNANAAGSLYQDVLTVPGTELFWELAHRARNADSSGSYYESATDNMYVTIMSTKDAEMLLSGVSQNDQQDVLRTMVDSVLGGSTSVTNATYRLRAGTYTGENVTVTVRKISTTSEINRYYGSWYSANQWEKYEGTYQVPEGQYATRFFFVAGDTHTGNVTVGNLIDDVWFSTELPPPDPDKGNLTVVKTVTGVDQDADMSSYSVNISVNNGQLTGTIRNFTYQAATGNWTASVSFTNQNVGSYTVTETTAPDITGYEKVANGNTTTTVQVEENQTATATLTNAYTRSTGSLVVTKKVTGVAQGTGLSGYSVTVIVGEETETIENFEYDVTQNAYIGTATFSQLATGQYAVTEKVNGSIPDYKDAATGSITSASVEVLKNQKATATLINNYELDVKDYEFTKNWEGTPTSFEVKLSDGSDKNYSDLTVDVTADGTATVTGGNYTATVTGTSGKDWTVTVKNVPADSDYYVYEETTVDDKPVGSDNTTGKGTDNGDEWWQVSISGDTITNTHYTVERNDPKGSLKIYKTGEGNQPLSDVTFSLTGKGNQTTNASGYAEWTELDEGTYTLTETAPEGYVGAGPWTVNVEKVADTDPNETTTANGVTITYNDEIKVKVDGTEVPSSGYTITNSKVRASLTITKSVTDGVSWDSEGYTFTVTGPNDYEETVRLTSGKQSATLTGLLVGEYTITETNPDDSGDYKWTGVTYSGTGVTDNQDKTATVTIGQNDHNQTIAVTATNNYVLNDDGVLTITKNAVGAPDGTSFDFTVKINGKGYSGSYSINGKEHTATDGRITLTNDQTATISGLTRGDSYEVVEADYTANYNTTMSGTGSMDQSALKATGAISGTTSAVTYTNAYVTWDVTFTKADAAEGHSPLPGAKFILKDSNDKQVGEEVTSTNGTVTFDNVPVGVYSLWETKAPVGYEDVPDGGKDLEITVTVAKTGVTFRGTNSGFMAGLANFFSGGSDDSFAIVGDTLTVYNTHKTADIVVSKAVTGDYTPASGETFTFGLFTLVNGKYEAVKNNSGEAVTIEVAKDGTGTFTGLTTGETYYVAELNGDRTNYDWTVNYNVPAEQIKTANGVTYVEVVLDAESTATVKLTATNNYTRQTGDLTISKAVTYGAGVPVDRELADTTAYSFVLVGPDEVNGTYDDVQFTGGTSAQFTLIDKGHKTFEDLPTGEYTLKEVDPATGKLVLTVSAVVDDGAPLNMSKEQGSTTYALNPQTLEDGDDMKIVVTNRYDLGSDQNQAVIQVVKVDEQDNSRLSGVSFTLYSDSECKSQALPTATTDKNGLITFTLTDSKLDDSGTDTFYLKETSTPTGYQSNLDEVWEIQVTKDQNGEYKTSIIEPEEGIIYTLYHWFASLVDQSDKVSSQWDNTNHTLVLTVKNSRVTHTADTVPAEIEILKVDGATSGALTGAAFTLTHTGSDPISVADADDGDANGVITVTFNDATTGMTEDGDKTYTITETTPPTGYQAAKGTVGTVTVTRTTTSEWNANHTQYVTTTRYRAVVTPVEGETVLNDSGQLVVENDKLLNVTASKAWQNADGSQMTTAPAGASVKFTLLYKEKGSVSAYEEATTDITAEPTITLDGTADSSGETTAWTATWTGLSPDYDYQVEETQGYRDYTALNGGIAQEGIITNKRDSNSLTITKTVTKAPATLPVDIPNNTTFTVYDKDGNQYGEPFTYTDMTLVSGVMTKVLNNVPTGTYYVVETGADVTYYQLTVTGAYKDEKTDTVNDNEVAVTSTQPGTINITNEYEREPGWGEMTKLTIQKAVEDQNGDALSTTNSYYFKVTGRDVYGQTVTEYVTIALPADASGKTIDLPISNSAGYTVTEVTVASDSGVAVDEDNTPNAITNYDWTEVEFETVMGGVTTATNVVTLDEEDAAATVTATNTYTRKTTPDDAGLTITKNVTGDEGVIIPTDDEFTFTVLADGQPYTGAYTVDDETKNAGTGGTITLMKGETATIGSIPYGTTFTITETIDEGYTLTGVKLDGEDAENGLNFTIDETTTRAEVAFTNHYVTKGFTIVKEDAENHLYLPGAKFTVYEYDKETGVKTEPGTETAATDVWGETSVSNLPVGTYWMEETTAPKNYVLSNEAWIITVTKDDITVEKAEPSIGEQAIQFFTGSDLLVDGKLTVDNTPAEYKLTITKTVIGIAERDRKAFTHTYYFNVFRGKNFAEKLTTKPIAVTVNYDEDSDKITGSTTITSKEYSWLKADEYLVLEVTDTADTETYELTADSDTSTKVTLTQDQSQATIEATAELTNKYDRMLGSLSITKALDGETENEKLRAEVDDKEYTFVITAPSDEVMDYGTGTYTTSTSDGTTAATGTTSFNYDEEAKVYTATVTAKIGETVTISDLPTGTYTVAEDEKSADVEYWELEVTGEGSVEVTNNGTAEVKITNTYTREVPPQPPVTEDDLVSLTITKVVQDSRGGDLSALAASKNYYFQITGEDVYGDAPLTQKVTITGATSTDVKLIWGKYKVIEVDANGDPIDADSAAKIDGYQWNKVEYTDNVDINLDKSTTAATATATNIYEPVPMNIPVVKTWSGDYSSLPNRIEVALYANGNDTGLRLTMNSSNRIDANHWLGVFKSTTDHPLYRYENGGKEIVYSVVELSINGYAVNGNTLGYWTVTTGRTTAGTIDLTGYDDDATVLTVRNDYDLPDDDDDDDDDPTPSPSTEPTPSPSTEPTPSPSDEVEIPDDDTPLGDQPEEVTEDIPDDNPPLGDQPDEPDETDIFEEGTPMGNLPQTGTQGAYGAVDPTQTLGMLALSASLMAAGLMILIGRRKDEESEED